MTETPDPKDNAQAERINNTIKNELLKGKRFKTIKEAKAELASVIEFYNTKCGFLKKVDSVNVTLLLILLYVDF